MTSKSSLQDILPEASIEQVETSGELFQIQRQRHKAPDDTILVRFVSPEEDQAQLLDTDNNHLEVLFYDDAVNRWNIQLIWALTMDTELDEDIQSDLQQDTRFAIRRSVNAEDLPAVLAPMKTVREEINEIESEFERGDLIQSILDANLGFLFRKDETSRTERLESLINEKSIEEEVPVSVSTDPDRSRIHEINLGSEFRNPDTRRGLTASQFTLLHGPNGSGKTSLLDGAAMGMVGQVKREDNRSRSYDGLQVSLIDDEGTVRALSNEPGAVADRIAEWYGYRPRGNANRHLEFYRVNYHEAGVTTRIVESGSDQNLEQTIQRFIYGEQISEAIDEKEKLIALAEDNIEEIETELRELEGELHEVQSDLARVEDTYSKANTAAKDLSSATRELVSAPPEVEGDVQSDGRGESTEWLESWREWEERFERLRKSLEALPDSDESLDTVSALYTAFSSSIEQLEAEIDSLDALKEIQTHQAEIHQLQEEFGNSPWADISASTAVVASVLGSNEIQLADLKIIRDAARGLDEQVSADSVNDWVATLRERLAAREETLRDRKKELETVSDIQGRRREIHDDLQSLMDEFLSVTQSVDYCPACYTANSKQTLENREQPGDLFDEDTEVPEALRLELTTLSDALEVLDSREWAEVHYDIETRFSDLCGIENFEEVLTLATELSSFDEFPTASTNGIPILADEMRRFDTDFNNAPIFPLLEQIDVSLQEQIQQRSKNVSRYEPAEDDLPQVREQLSEQRERIAAGRHLIETHVPESVWSQDINISQDHSILQQTLEGAYDSPTLTESIKDLEADVAECETAIGENQSRKEALEDGIERLNDAFERVGGDAELTDLVDQHMTVITTLFQAFQRPYEFKSVQLEDGTVTVTRRGENSSEPVDQMSSGQRAALALAIFITNNLTHPRAPRVIMLDEPFAHLDDINTVSFFNLLLRGMTEFDRQIIFATANTDIADLLEQKIGNSSDFDRIDLHP